MRKKIPLIASIAVLILFFIAYLYIPKSYNIYSQAIEMAKRDMFVKSKLGDNINDSLFAYSNIHKGMAKIEVTITGDKGSGLLVINGNKTDNNWKLTSVLFEHDSIGKRYAVYKSKK